MPMSTGAKIGIGLAALGAAGVFLWKSGVFRKMASMPSIAPPQCSKKGIPLRRRNVYFKDVNKNSVIFIGTVGADGCMTHAKYTAATLEKFRQILPPITDKQYPVDPFGILDLSQLDGPFKLPETWGP